MSAPVMPHDSGVSVLGTPAAKPEMSMHVFPSSQTTSWASPSPRQNLNEP